MSSTRSIRLSTSFVLSSGTITLDLQHRKLLLIWCRNSNETLLPKGRKNRGETLNAAALRETYEETGYRARPLPLNIATLAAHRVSMDVSIPSDETTSRPIRFTDHRVHTEPVAVTQRLSGGALKIIFWYAATADSSSSGEGGTQQEGEDYEALWVSYEEGRRKLTFDDDRAVASYVIDAASS